jgi:hypothetical protein
VRRPLAGVAAALLLTACGSAGSSSSSPSSSSSGSPAGGSSSSASAATAGTGGPTTTTTSANSATENNSAPQASAAGAGCSAHQIDVSTAPGGAATSHIGLILRFRNTGDAPCVLTGYPGATFSTAAGHEVQARRTPAGFIGGLSGSSHPPVVHVARGQVVSALLEGLDADMTHGGRPCPRYAHLLVTPPNQRVTIRLPTPLARICAPEIHPVVTGSAG